MLQTVVGKRIVIKEEVPAGAVDGVNTVYTLDFAVADDTLEVYLNGLKQRAGASNDYVVLSATQIEFNDAPLTNDVVTVDYERY